MSHTKGPWKVYFTKDGGKIIGIGDAEGAGVTDPHFGLWSSGEEQEANARLIAAAPDLLEACKAALSVIKANFPTEQSEFMALEKLDAAIAKAEGE